MDRAMLLPALVLVLWSIAVLIYGASVRFPAIRRAGLDLSKGPRGGRGGDLDKLLGAAQWPVHNYNHLMEQPTLFYAVVAALAIMGEGTQGNLALAWAYVAICVVHSIWQTFVNIVMVRVVLFFTSTLVLLALAVRATLAALV